MFLPRLYDDSHFVVGQMDGASVHSQFHMHDDKGPRTSKPFVSSLWKNRLLRLREKESSGNPKLLLPLTDVSSLRTCSSDFG